LRYSTIEEPVPIASRSPSRAISIGSGSSRKWVFSVRSERRSVTTRPVW
jgi:hypothetical protein